MSSKHLQLSRKSIAIFLSLILVCSVTAGLIGYNLARPHGVSPGAPTYTIWSEGGVTYAKDAYGAIPSSWGSSINASYVIQNALNAGGATDIRGTLTCTNTLILSVIGTTLYSTDAGKLICDGVNGLIITATQASIHDLTIEQLGYGRTKTGITVNGTNAMNLGYNFFNNLHVWGWNIALQLNYTWNSAFSGIDTTYSYTALDVWGQSASNTFSNCFFNNIASGTEATQPTVIIERDDVLDIWPEGNLISNSVIFGGTIGVYLRYADFTKISNSVIDNWKQIGVFEAGGFDNTLNGNWIGNSLSTSSISLLPNTITIQLATAKGASIIGNTLYARNWTLYAYGGCTDTQISNNKFVGAANIDIYSYTNIGGVISGNQFHPIGSSGSLVGVLLQSSQSYTINDNAFSNETRAIYFESSNHNSITGNVFNATLQTAVILDGASYNSVTSNSIYNSGQAADGSYYGIWLVDGSQYNSVSSNIISDTGAIRNVYGIYEAEATDNYNLYAGNVITGYSIGAIGLAGANSTRGTNIPATG